MIEQNLQIYPDNMCKTMALEKLLAVVMYNTSEVVQ
jgi:hypothetical protein